MKQRLCKICAARCGSHEFCRECSKQYYTPQYDGISDDDVAAGIVTAAPVADGHEAFSQRRRSRKRPINDARGDFLLRVTRG